MNSRIILAVCTLAVLSSCSTAYKAQTPDDVYYSPAKPQDEYVKVESQKDREEYRADDGYTDDRYLRWKVRNRNRWSVYDDYSYDAYDYRYTHVSIDPFWSGNSYYWSNYWYWNRSYNPYCGKVIVVNPKNTIGYNQVRNYTPGTYNTTYSNNNNSVRTKNSPGAYRPTGSYNNTNSSSLGSSIKKVFSNSSSNNSSSGDSRPGRTYTPPSSNNNNSSSGSSNSSGSSGGSSGGSVTRPSRGG